MGTSAQNFIDLLFGGVNKGLDVARQQQGQQVDLALTIQQMLARQKAGQQEQQNWEKSFGAEQNWRREQRNRQAGLDVQGAGQQAFENYLAKFKMQQETARLDLLKQANAALIKLREAQVGKVTGGTPEGFEPDREALSSLLTTALRDPVNYESIEKKAYKKLTPQEKSTFQPVFAPGSSDVMYYKRLAPHIRGKMEQWQQALEGLGGVLQGPVKPPPQEESDEDIINSLYEGF